jgi:hypothetical protein
MSVPTAAPQPVQQPVQGAPTPVGGGGVQQTTQTGGQTQAIGGSTFAGPTPNPYNLPDDLVQGQTQQGQLGGLLGQFEQSRLDANAANEARYAQAIQGYQDLDQAYSQRTQDLMGNLQGFGDADRQALQDRFTQQQGGLTQDLISRGLYNATTLDQSRQALGTQQQRQSLQLEDMLRRQEMDYGKALTGEELANRPRVLEAMERRTDAGPSYQDVAGVSGAVGASQANVPDYLSALGGEGYAQQAIGGGGTGTGAAISGGSRLDPTLNVSYQTPNTRSGFRSTGGSAGQSSFTGSRRSSGSSQRGSRSSGGGQSSSGGGLGDSFDGGRTGPETLRQTGGNGGAGQGSGKPVTIMVNDDGSYRDMNTGQDFGSMDELQKARGATEQQIDQSNEQQPDPLKVTEPLKEGGGGQSETIQGPSGPIEIPFQQEGENWYRGLPPIFYAYQYGSVPGIGIMQGQNIAAQISKIVRARKQ